jgi:hypothetical protein
MPEPERRTHSGTASLTPPHVFLRTRTWRSTYEGKNQIHTHHHTDVSTYPPAYFPHESITGSLYVVLYGMKRHEVCAEAWLAVTANIENSKFRRNEL